MLKKISLVFLLGTTLLLVSSAALADKVCIKSRITAAGRIRMRKVVLPSTSSCASGFLEVVDTSSLTGPQGAAGTTGATGTAGAEGAAGVYGDATLGDVVVPNGDSILQNGMYNDFTIESGSTVTAQSGTVIRATGTCTINGTVNVSTFAAGGIVLSPVSDTRRLASRDPHPGQAKSVPTTGEVLGSTSPATALNGTGGLGFGSGTAYDSARNLIRPGNLGGGGGGSAFLLGSVSTSSNSGGGTIVFLCQNGITIGAAGFVNAIGAGAGADASGGGGGGIVVLATPSNLDIQGTVDVRGGNGANANTSVATAAGGGGGGGLIISLYGGTLNASGTTVVTGGIGGTSAGAPAPSLPFVSGSGGGASYGNGGDGGGARSSSLTSRTNGSPGGAIFFSEEPTKLFF